jgi:putative PIN family toxin of toxin-antitoxin system
MAQPQTSAVFDCMVFLQAVISETGAAAELFRYVESNAVRLFVSKEVLIEIRDVLTRPKVLLKYPHVTTESVDIFIGRIMVKAAFIKNPVTHFEYSRDPKDQKYINLAAEAKAGFLVSRDRDLLDLMTGADIESKEFRQKFRSLKVVSPEEFLKIISALPI